MALPMVLLAGAVLGVLAIVSLHVSVLGRSADSGSLESTMAFYAAEAGLHNVSIHTSDRLVSAWVLQRV